MTFFPRSISTLFAALLAVSVTAAAAPPLVVDGDGDGISDDRDECPYSGTGEKVNAEGCAVDSDVDGDGVGDLADLCPYSTIGAKVDAKGCALDEDFDGVANSKDQCPNSAYGERVDSRGCEIIVPGAKSKAVAKKEEPVPVTRVSPPAGPAAVILKANPNYVDENELFAPAPPRPDARPTESAAVPLTPSLPVAPTRPEAPITMAPAAPAVAISPPVKEPEVPVAKPVPAPAEQVVVQVAPSHVAAPPVVSPPSPATAVAIPVREPEAPIATTVPPQPVEQVVIQVAPSHAAEPALPEPVVPIAASVSVPVKGQAAASVPAPATPQRPAIEPVVVPPEVLRATAEQRATMSPATADRTPSLPKAATVDLPVQSLPADSFPPGYAPNRPSPQVNVPVGTVPGLASGNARKLPVTPVPPASAAVAPKAPPVSAPAVAVTPRAPVPVTPPPAVPVPVGTASSAAAAQAARSGVPVVGLPPVGDSFPQTPIPSPAAQGNPGDTLAEIGFAAGSAEMSAEATQRVRQLAGTISSRLSGDPSLALRLAGRRHAGEPAAVDVGRGLALRKAFLAEGIDDTRIRIVIIDGPAPAAGDYQVSVQLIAVP